MIYVTDDLRANVKIDGLPVYLDQWAIIELARPTDLRRRFLDAIHAGRGTLLFSQANLWEIGGPQGNSKSRVGDFLSEIGPRWIPIKGAAEVLSHELAGQDVPVACTSFLKNYIHDRIKERNPSDRSLDVRDPSFFDLGRIAHWTKEGPKPETLDGIHQELCRVINSLRSRFESGEPVFAEIAAESLLPHQRATYVFKQLTYMMIRDAKAKPFAQHDFADLCHAVLALSFGLIATLDKRWRDRAKEMAHADCLARVYFAPELEQFVGDLETSEPPWERDAA